MRTAPKTEMDEIIKALRKHPGYRPPSPESPSATEKTLKEVWRLWNLLPGDWAPDMRVGVLGCSERSFASMHTFHSGQRTGRRRANLYRNKTKPVSAKFLKAWAQPLGEESRAALVFAAWWHKFAREDYLMATKAKTAQVQQYLVFKDDDLPVSDDRVATWRTGRELIARKKYNDITLGQFWELPEPPLALIQFARKRWHAYREARKKARLHLGGLEMPGKISDYASPADAFTHSLQGLWSDDDVAEFANQLTDDEKEMVQNPAKLLEFVSRNLKKAQNLEGVLSRTHRTTPQFLSNLRFMLRCGCGLVGQDELRLTLPTFFLKLSLDEKLKFLKISHARPRNIMRNRRALLATWLEDNAPIFSEFGWHTEAVLGVAAAILNDPDKKWISESPESMTQFCSRATPRIRLGLHRARYQNETARFAQPHRDLLTAPPLSV